MHNRLFVSSIGLFISCCITSSSVAQYTYNSLERLGLQRKWSTIVDSDATLGGIAGVSISVNHDDARAIPIYTVEYDGGSKRFTQFDIGANGVAIGAAEALRLAEVEELRKKSLSRNPVLTTKKVKPVDIFVTTTGGVLQSINAETGRTNWSVSVGNPNRPTSAPTSNDWYVAVVNGSTLYVVRRDNGEPVFDRQLQSSPMVGAHSSDIGPAMTNYGFETIDDAPVSKDWIYVPCTRGRLEAYKVGDSSAPPWFTTTRGDVVGKPVIGAGYVAWTSSSGYLMVAGAVDHEMRFRLQTGYEVDSSAAYVSPGRFFVGARNGYLYAVDKKTENTVWEFSTAQPILDRPIGIGEDIFVITQDENMYCVSAADGTEKWMAPAIHSFLSASENRIYAADDRGQMVVLSRRSGARLGPAIRINATPIVNTETDRVYVVSKLGNIYAFGEIGAEFPMIHQVKEILEDDKPLARGRAPADAAENPIAPAETSPSDVNDFPGFGDESAEDPGADVDDNPFDFGGGTDPTDGPTTEEPAPEETPVEGDLDMDDDNPFDFGEN